VSSTLQANQQLSERGIGEFNAVIELLHWRIERLPASLLFSLLTLELSPECKISLWNR
jgi:hypothetical protein